MSRLYATWEAAAILGTTRKALWYYQSKGYIEGTKGDDGFLYYTKEQIANAKLPASTMRHIAEKRALLRESLGIREPAPLSSERENIQLWASLPWREWTLPLHQTPECGVKKS